MTWRRLPTAAVVVAAFWAIAVAGASFLPMTDPDTWWHIRAGREILATGSVPNVDTWSIAGAGRPWVSQDWASNVFMAALYDLGPWGASLVSAAYGLIAAAALAVLWNAIGVRRSGTGWLARVAWLLVGLVLAAPVLGARVQVVDLLLATMVLNVLWRWLDRPRNWHLVALPAIALVWVNLHAGWPLLFLLGGAVIVGEAIDGWLRPGVRPARGRSLVPLGVALGGAALVLPLNPNGLAIYGYPFATLGIGALSAFIGEWQPARLDAAAGQLLLAFALIGIIPTLLLARHRLRLADALILLGLAYMALTAVRFLLVAGPIGAAIVCVNLAPVLATTAPGQALPPVLSRFSRPPRPSMGAVNLVLVVAVALVGIGVSALRISPDGQARAISEVLPTGAVASLGEQSGLERVFNRYEWGGYLGLSLPDRPIFIDGRADVYGDEIIREYVEVISVNQDPEAYFERHSIDHVLYPPDSPLGRWMEGAPGWTRTYADSVAAVWVRD